MSGEDGVFPLSPVPQRNFAYSHAHKHNSLNTADTSFKTREAILLQRPSPPRLTSTLSSADVAGASPSRLIPADVQRRWRDQHEKSGSLSTLDIGGAQPHCRHVKLRNKPDTVYSCRDIHRAWPHLKPALSDRMVSPLMPEYKFPSSRPGPPVIHFAGTQPLPHARTIPNCADIHGASPSLRFMKTQQRVSSFQVNDVQTKRQRPVIKNRRSPLDVDDIINDPAGAGHVFRSTRTTNTLDARYDWDKPANWNEQAYGKWEIGGYDGEKPSAQMSAKGSPLRLAGKPMPGMELIDGSKPMALHSQQLQGAARAFREGHIHNRREVRHTNHISDIQGAQADTLETAVRTTRCTNPLTPDYPWDCYDPTLNIGNDRYLNTPRRQELEAGRIRRQEPEQEPEPASPPQSASPVKSAKELDEALNAMKSVFHERGAFTGRKLAQVIRHFDDGDGQITREELKDGLENYLGQKFGQQELDHMVDYFDKDRGGTIDIAEFLNGIRGNMRKNRMDAVEMAFEHLDQDSSGRITLNEIEVNYNPSNHVKVLSGEITRDEALQEFLTGWDADSDGGVTKQEFVDYFKDISLAMPNDLEFIDYVKNIFVYTEAANLRKSQEQGQVSTSSRQVSTRRPTPFSNNNAKGL